MRRSMVDESNAVGKRCLFLCACGVLLWLGLALGGVGCGPRLDCRKNSDCEAPARFCALGICKECFTDNDCSSSDVGPYCDPKTFLCVLQAQDGGDPDLPSGPCEPGKVEECYTGPAATREKGLCRAGKRTCLDTKSWSPCANQTLPTEETCDEKDNDCDGEVDEGIECTCKLGDSRRCYSGPVGTAGVGLCKQGTQTCLVRTWGSCSGQVLPTKEICDEKDNDCDGQVDEGLEDCGGECTPGVREACYNGTPNTKDVGPCKAGTRRCSATRKWGACTGQVLPATETCDGVDNNCDGKIDEIAACKCTTPGQVKSCQSTKNPLCTRGVQTCQQNGIWSTCATESRRGTETCDNKDNDCDGQIDESPSGAPACPQQKGVCQGSKARCEGGKWLPCDAKDYTTANKAYEADESTCDNKDNDCDGLVDEDTKGCVTLVAGSGSSAYRDGQGATASFNYPAGLAMDSSGRLFVGDSRNNTIRLIDLQKQNNVTGFAGDIASGFSDGKGSAARFNRPMGLTIIGSGLGSALLVADQLNSRIRAIDPSGTVVTVAGLVGKAPQQGYLDGQPDVAMFNRPQGVAILGQTIYVADTGNHAIRMIDKDGTVSTIAGNCTTSCQSGYKDGAGATALFSSPVALAFDGQNTLYIADAGNHCIRALDLGSMDKNVTTYAGVCGRDGSSNGARARALFNTPSGLALDAMGALYVADRGNHRIRKISSTVTTVAGSTSGSVNGPTSSARFQNPSGLTIDPQGHIYVSEFGGHRIRKITLP